MSSIAASSPVNALVRIDQVCDYSPIVSTITNLFDIFEKSVFKGGFCSSDSINSNRYFSHINDKSILRCIILLVPILGNIIVGIYDLIQNHAEGEERKNQNLQALRLGLEVSQLPQSISERRQIIENKRLEKLQESTQEVIKALDTQIEAVRQSIETFGKIIENPDEPLEVICFFGLIRRTYIGSTHRDKIDYFWSNIKLMIVVQELGSSWLGRLDQNETISKKQQEISKLKKELLQLRQTSYRGHLQAINKEELLQEAKKYYLESFSTEESQGIKMSVEQMTLETIQPKLRARVLAQAEKNYAIVEMQEIISQIESV